MRGDGAQAVGLSGRLPLRKCRSAGRWVLARLRARRAEGARSLNWAPGLGAGSVASRFDLDFDFDSDVDERDSSVW